MEIAFIINCAITKLNHKDQDQTKNSSAMERFLQLNDLILMIGMIMFINNFRNKIN